MLTNTIIAVVTAYCSCSHCCGPNAKGITANGRIPTQGRTIAAPRKYSFGTVIIISGQTYLVEDRTAKRYDGRFDVYFDKHQDAKNFGIKTNKITIIGNYERIEKTKIFKKH